MSKKVIYNIIKWLFVIAAFAYLAYKLITFDNYTEFFEQWKNAPPARFGWLIIVLLLLPVNWGLETLKWKYLVSNVQKISFSNALKGVLSGITTGFFTPNRIGDMVGRAVYMQHDNRPAGIALSIVNSLTQNLIIILCGIPACILFFFKIKSDQSTGIIWFIIIACAILILLILVYFSLPFFSKKLKHTKLGKKLANFIGFLSTYSTHELLTIILITFCRYAVFSFQFFLMLRFFNIELTAWQALIAIPTNYLFVTITPSIAFSEAAVRASYAVMLFSEFSSNTANLVLAGATIWFINWVIPLLIGSVFVAKSKI